MDVEKVSDSLAAGIKATGGQGEERGEGEERGDERGSPADPGGGRALGPPLGGPAPPPDRGGGTGAGPPFDGKPCPMCPVEIRGLHGAAHNALNRFDDIFKRGYDGDSAWFKLREKMEELRAAVEKVRPLSDAHFADRRHSHGE
jgi:hypothetical protein